jgi:hypothetical protein
VVRGGHDARPLFFGHNRKQTHQKVREVKEAIAKGAAEKMWSTRFEVDYGLRWNHERQVWAGADSFAYEPPTRVGARGDRFGL